MQAAEAEQNRARLLVGDGGRRKAMQQPAAPGLLLLLFSVHIIPPAGGTTSSPLLSIEENAFTWPGRQNFAFSRLSAVNRTLQLDGETVLLRGATYSPTPIGKDMSSADAAQRVADFFVDAEASLRERDLPLMRQMGMNSVRVYELQPYGEHKRFLDLAYANNITVLAGFPLLNDVHDLRDTTNVASAGQLNMGDLSLQVQGWLAHLARPGVARTRSSLAHRSALAHHSCVPTHRAAALPARRMSRGCFVRRCAIIGTPP